MVMNFNEPVVAFKFAAANSGQMLHMLYLTVPCEEMSSQSNEICNSM